MTDSSSITTITNESLAKLARDLLDKYAQVSNQRAIIAIAGSPGSGKSTLAEMLTKQLNILAESKVAATVPMDGFHYTQRELGLKRLMDVKGTPATFDCFAYTELLTRLKDARDEAYFPIYDRDLHEPVYIKDDAHRIVRDTRFVVTEGNYLLLDQAPWGNLMPLFDECLFVQTSKEQCCKWLMARHLQGKQPRTAQQARDHVQKVDQPNIELVSNHSQSADFYLTWPEN